METKTVESTMGAEYLKLRSVAKELNLLHHFDAEQKKRLAVFFEVESHKLKRIITDKFDAVAPEMALNKFEEEQKKSLSTFFMSEKVRLKRILNDLNSELVSDDMLTNQLSSTNTLPKMVSVDNTERVGVVKLPTSMNIDTITVSSKRGRKKGSFKLKTNVMIQPVVNSKTVDNIKRNSILKPLIVAKPDGEVVKNHKPNELSLTKNELNQVLNSIKDVKFKKDKIEKLASQGHDRTTIAKLLGSSLPYVYMVLEDYSGKKKEQTVAV